MRDTKAIPIANIKLMSDRNFQWKVALAPVLSEQDGPTSFLRIRVDYSLTRFGV